MSSRRVVIASFALLSSLLVGCGDDGPSDAAAIPDAEDSNGTETSGAGDDPVTDSADGEGVKPESIEANDQLPHACDLVEPDERQALVGDAAPEVEEDTAIDGLDYSQCSWESDDTLLIVAVIEGPDRFELHTENLRGEPVTGIGQDALVAPGVSSETKGATGGRTVSALVDGNTVVVALKLTGETTNEDIVPLATAVANRL